MYCAIIIGIWCLCLLTGLVTLPIHIAVGSEPWRMVLSALCIIWPLFWLLVAHNIKTREETGTI